VEDGGYDFQIKTFQDLKNAAVIPETLPPDHPFDKIQSSLIGGDKMETARKTAGKLAEAKSSEPIGGIG
jgi:hypothetical protein